MRGFSICSDCLVKEWNRVPTRCAQCDAKIERGELCDRCEHAFAEGVTALRLHHLRCGY